MARKRSKSSPQSNQPPHQEPSTGEKQVTAAVSGAPQNKSKEKYPINGDTPTNGNTPTDTSHTNPVETEHGKVDTTEARVVDAVVDRRFLESDNPQPIHPMNVVKQHLGETGSISRSTEPETAKATENQNIENFEQSSTLLVEAIAIAVEQDQPTTAFTSSTDTDPNTDADNITDAVTVTSDSTRFPPQVGDELSGAIATAQQHEANLEAHLLTIEQQHNHLEQQLTLAQSEIASLKQQLADSRKQESLLQQQVTTLQTECDRTTTKLNQWQARLTDQATAQQEIDALHKRISGLTNKLDAAENHIQQLLETPSLALPQSAHDALPQAAHDRETDDNHQLSPLQSTKQSFVSATVTSATVTSATVNQSPLAKVPSGRSPGGLVSKPLSGLPPMSTERLHGQQVGIQQNQRQISRSSERLRPAYTRPGFSNTPPSRLDSGKSATSRISTSPGPTTPSRQPLSLPSSTSRGNDNKDARIARHQAPIVQRRSRSYDTLHPELKSSDLPKPKVSDAEIGWFD